MNIPDIAMQALAVASPFISKGVEEFSKGIGGDLWKKIKEKFSKTEETQLLKEIEEKPGNERTQGRFEQKLTDLLNADPDFKSEIMELLKTAMQQEKNVTNITQNNKYGNNIGRDNITYNK